MRKSIIIKLAGAAACMVFAVMWITTSLRYMTPHEDSVVPTIRWQGLDHLDEMSTPVSAQSGAKAIALTFDDGPNKVHTAPLLDYLKEQEVTATFFVLGMNAEKNGELIKRIDDEGHQIGNHGYNHTSFTQLSGKEIEEQINKTSDIIEEHTGKRPILTRPPHGEQNKRVKEAVNMPMILWSIDPRDWNTSNSQKVYERVVNRAQPGDIILLHDISKSTVEAVKKIVPELKKRGYTFVTVEELLISVYGEVDDFNYSTAKH